MNSEPRVTQDPSSPTAYGREEVASSRMSDEGCPNDRTVDDATGYSRGEDQALEQAALLNETNGLLNGLQYNAGEGLLKADHE